MTEEWQRLQVPCSPGFGTCSGPTFTVTYDSANDRLVIISDLPVFDAIDSLNFAGTGGSGTTFAVDGQGPSEVWVNDAAATLLAPTDITHLDFFDAGPALIGTWIGTVHIDAVGTHTYPLLEGIYSPAVNQVAFVGQRFQTATSGAITNATVRLASYAAGCFEGPTMGVTLASPTSGWSVVTFTDTLIVLENAKFTTCTPDNAEADFTVDGVAFAAPNYGTPAGDGYYFYEPWAESTYSRVIDGTTPPPP